jgi:hypothetical protein
MLSNFGGGGTTSIAELGTICVSSPAVPTLPPGVTPTATPIVVPPTSTPTPTPIPTFNITGIVYVDTNRNGARDAGEGGFSGVATINATGPTPRTTFTNATGNYSFLRLLGGLYRVTLTVPPGFVATTATSVLRTLGPSSAINFGIAPLFTISGIVYVDTNENGARDAGEAGFNGAAVRAAGPSTANSTTAGAGNYLLANLVSGSYTVTLTVPAGHFATTANPVSRTLGPSSIVNFGIAPMHSISGNVFVDSNNNKIKDGAEANYTLGIIITSAAGTVTYPSAGAFNVSGLPTGTYTIYYANKPLGYIMTFPVGQIGLPFMNFDVGFPCSGFFQTPVTVGTCDALGNITNANFGINFANPWFSSRGVDMRVDSGFDDLDIPASAIPPFASLDGTGGMPGIIFSGNENADFGPFGQASSNG